MNTKQNQICKKEGHRFYYSRIFSDLVCCKVCGMYRRALELEKEERDKYYTRKINNG